MPCEVCWVSILRSHFIHSICLYLRVCVGVKKIISPKYCENRYWFSILIKTFCVKTWKRTDSGFKLFKFINKVYYIHVKFWFFQGITSNIFKKLTVSCVYLVTWLRLLCTPWDHTFSWREYRGLDSDLLVTPSVGQMTKLRASGIPESRLGGFENIFNMLKVWKLWSVLLLERFKIL